MFIMNEEREVCVFFQPKKNSEIYTRLLEELKAY